PRRRRSPVVVPQVKIWLENEGRYFFGLGFVKVLQAVEQTGSIKQAAGSLGKSYRHVWSWIKEAEGALGTRLVETHVGGAGTQRSFLTDTARRLVKAFLSLRHRVSEFVADE